MTCPLLPALLATAPAAAVPRSVNLLIILAGIALLMVAVAGLGRLLAAGHPEPPPRRTPGSAQTPRPTLPVAPEVLAAISAAVVTVLGSRAHVTSVQLEPPVPAPSVEALMGQWSLEGRRQIYSSHKVR